MQSLLVKEKNIASYTGCEGSRSSAHHVEDAVTCLKPEKCWRARLDSLSEAFFGHAGPDALHYVSCRTASLCIAPLYGQETPYLVSARLESLCCRQQHRCWRKSSELCCVQQRCPPTSQEALLGGLGHPAEPAERSSQSERTVVVGDQLQECQEMEVGNARWGWCCALQSAAH